MKGAEQKHIFDVLFVVILFFVFLICALTVVVIGSNVYRNSISRMNEHFSSKTALHYIIEKNRQNDAGSGRSLIQIENQDVLLLRQNIDEIYYNTLIYSYENRLMELFIREDTDISLASGKVIMEGINLAFQLDNNNLLEVIVTDENGNISQVSIAERSGL